jgi:hypothetical protein
MILAIAIGTSLIVGFGLIAALVMRRRFAKHLDAIDAELRKPATMATDRSDLPAEVLALAARLGARVGGQPDFAVFEQSGQMWQQPGEDPMNFCARQTVRVDAPGFLWRAVTDLPKSIIVADYFIGGIGGLEVRLLGIFPFAHMVGGTSVNQGEVLRYLAELPLNPDAILANRALDWTVVDPKSIKVATGLGASRGVVTFVLDDDGLIVIASAPSRIYLSENGPIARPWHGRFWDYRRAEGRLIPMQAEVAWSLDAGEFVYWRGSNFNWHQPSAWLVSKTV